jgi:hypothetical protein
MKRHVIAASLVAASLVGWARAAHAHEVAVGASFQEGLSVDTSGIHRLTGGGMMGFGRFALDAAIDIEIWDPWMRDKGTEMQALGLTVGGKVSLTGKPHMIGPYLTFGGAYLRVRDGSKKIVNAQLGQAPVGPNAVAARAGIGYGFRTTDQITIAVRFDVNVWFIETDPFPPEATDPWPNPISFHIGLEMLRWF